MNDRHLTPNQAAGGFARDGQTDPPLFRPEALAALNQGLGRPIAVLPLSWAGIGVVLGALIVAFVIFLSVGTYSRKETAYGIVRSVGGDIRIEASAPGVASDVLVTEGQRVRAGDTLVVVETPRNSLDGRAVGLTIIASLDRELADLERRIDALDMESTIDRNSTASRLRALQVELGVAQTQETSVSERLSLAADAFERTRHVADKGFISGEAMRRRKEEVIVLRQAIADARGLQSRLGGQIAELKAYDQRRPLELLRQRGQLQDAAARIRRERESYAGQQGYSIKAPSEGTISALQVSKGQAVNPQRVLMTLGRPGAAVSAEIFVPSRAVGFLESGQEVKVRYDAFPYQRFGVATGRVRSISSTILRPEEVQAAIKIEEPVYRVLIELDDDQIHAYGKAYRIRPGLALNASIVLDKRTFGEWLLDPIIALRGRL